VGQETLRRLGKDVKLAFLEAQNTKKPQLVYFGPPEFDVLVDDLNKIKAEVQQEMEVAKLSEGLGGSQDERAENRSSLSSSTGTLGASSSNPLSASNPLKRSNPLRRSVQSNLLEKSLLKLNLLQRKLVRFQRSLVEIIPKGVEEAENLANFVAPENAERTLDQIKHELALRTGAVASFDFAWLASLLVSSKPLSDLHKNNPFITDKDCDALLLIVAAYAF
jgi:hypothetical protein